MARALESLKLLGGFVDDLVKPAVATTAVAGALAPEEAEAGMVDVGLKTLAKQGKRLLRSDAGERAVTRGVRETLESTAKLTAAEKAVIRQSVDDAGYGSYKAAQDAARSMKARFPTKGTQTNWAPFDINKMTVSKDNAGKISYKPEASKQGYQFHIDPSTGKEADRGSAHYQNMVDAVSNEIIATARMAENGDPAARKVMENAGWYRNVESRGFNEYGSFYDTFGDLLGATSPNTPVKTNFNFSRDILQRMSKGEFDDQIDRFADGMDRIDELVSLNTAATDTAKATDGMSMKAAKLEPDYVERLDEIKAIKKQLKEDSIRQAGGEKMTITKGGKAKVEDVEAGKKYGINSDNAMVALSDRWRTFRKGDAPKAKNFSGNLVGYSIKPTIDVWSARNLRRHAGLAPIPSPGEQGVTGQILDPVAFTSTQEFGFGQDVLTDATARVNQTLGMDLEPRDMQALQWFAEKDVWSKNGWTNAAGEGGSFETMMDLNPTESLVVGTSRAQSMEYQGQDFVPGPRDQLETARRFMDEAATDPDVIAAKAPTTHGLYGEEPEISFDVDIVSNEHAVPASTLDQVARQAVDDSQDSFFVARRIKPEVSAGREEMFQVGTEAYFHAPVAPDSDQIKALQTHLNDQGVQGFTLIVDPRQRPGAMADEVIGVRFLDIPQFYDADNFATMSPQKYSEHVGRTFDEYTNINAGLKESFPDIRSAETSYYDVNVRSRDAAQEYVAQLENPKRDTEVLRQEMWGFKPARTRFQEYSGQARPYYSEGSEGIRAAQAGSASPLALATLAAASTVAGDFARRRQQKRNQWQNLRTDLLQTIGKAVAESPMGQMAMAATQLPWQDLDKPMQGLYGLNAAANTLRQGGGFDAAMQRGGQVASQPIEQTAQGFGDAMFEATGSPAAATAAYTAGVMAGPI